MPRVGGKRVSVSKTVTKTVTKKPRTFRRRAAVWIPRGSISVKDALPLKNKLDATLRYAHTVSLNAAAGSNAVQVYAANGLFDPDVTGVGGQPRGFDQIAAMYNFYRVKQSKIVVDFVYEAAASTVPVLVGILLSTDTMPLSGTIGDFLETGNVVYKMMSPDLSSKVRLSLAVTPHKYLQTDEEEPSLGNYVTANPTSEIVYFVVFVLAINAGDPVSIRILTSLDYKAEFMEPIAPTAS